MNSFITKKLTHLYNLFDANQNGKLEENDFIIIAQRLAAEKGWKENSIQYCSLKASYSGLWMQIKNFADKNGDGIVDLSEWLNWNKELLSSEDSFVMIYLDITNVIFDVVDFNSDGKVDAEDFTRFFRGYGIPAEQGTPIFKRLDLNSNGELSKMEIVVNVKEFFYSEDENAPGNDILGYFR